MFENVYKNSKIIQLKPIIRTSKEANLVAQKNNITLYDATDQFKWHLINGNYYRFKFFDKIYPILNELIGPKIAQNLELRSANNLPAKMKFSNDLTFYGILSENFKEPNKEYLTMFELGFSNKTMPNYKNLNKLKRYCSKDDYDELLNNILKMTALDYLMGQVDRVASNFLFEKDEHSITFAPLFDYAEAYEYAKIGCYFNTKENRTLNCSVGNSLIAPAFWESRFKRFLRKYPQFRDYLNEVCKINIVEIIEEIEKEHQIKISDECKDYYDFRTKEKQKILY